jgi:predicted dehydrogenase
MNDETQDKKNKEETTPPGEKQTFGRRDILKALATVPVLGVFFYKLGKKQAGEEYRKKEVLAELGLDKKAPAVLPKTTFKKTGELIRVGIIGCGGRGEAVMRAAGFAHPEWTDQKKRDAYKNLNDTSLADYLGQDDLNIAITGVSDVFDIRAERGIEASKNQVRPGGQKKGASEAKRYLSYREMLDSGEVDAVIIAVPEHLHSEMILDSISAGKHIYAEKPFAKTIEESIQVADAVKASKIAFQLGHQNRQVESHIMAREMVEKNILGKITLVETTTNRNSPTGAWVMTIHKDASPENIDWSQFLGNAPRRPFNLERFFRWRCWFDYSNGIASDLLSHEYDSVNQILELGIPKTAVSSGGIYFYRDGRDTPDVLQVVFEYPDRGLTLMYSATLANERDRGMVFMGNDASMEVGGGITVMPDIGSLRYQKKIESGIIDVSTPMVAYLPGAKGFDAVTTATEKYFASKGLMYTYRDGKRVDSTYLHVKEWLDCIRNGGTPSCSIDRGFEEGVACQMAAASFFQGRKVEWDSENKKIV